MKLVLKTIVAFIVLVVVLNYLVPDPDSYDKKTEVENYAKNNNFAAAENTLKPLLKTNSRDIDLNYQYVSNHFSIPMYIRMGRSSHRRDDSEITAYYERMRNSADSATRDIGLYCSGLCCSYNESYTQAYDYYKQVKNKRLKYLNNSLGYYFKHVGQDSAEYYLQKEIALRGNMESAVSNLVDIYLAKKQVKQLSVLVRDKAIAGYISDTQLRKFYLSAGQYIAYISSVYESSFIHSDWYSLLSCVLIALLWLGYLKYIDVFEPEKWYHIALVFGVSILLSPLALLLYDLSELYLRFNINGSLWNDLLYCVFGIGLIEESIKLLTLLIFIRFFRKVLDEPIDYIIFACVSALGFAFVENLSYFGHDGYQIIHGRALSAAVAHMACSSIVAYGFVVARYKLHVKSDLPIFYALIVAACFHGVYDFWLVSDAVSFLSILSTFVMLMLIGVWNEIQTNALNNSPYFDKNKRIDEHRLRHYLFLGLMAILAVEYVIITIHCGPSVGFTSLIKSLWEGSYIMMILLISISRFKLKKNSWNKISI